MQDPNTHPTYKKCLVLDANSDVVRGFHAVRIQGGDDLFELVTFASEHGAPLAQERGELDVLVNHLDGARMSRHALKRSLGLWLGGELLCCPLQSCGGHRRIGVFLQELASRIPSSVVESNHECLHLALLIEGNRHPSLYHRPPPKAA